jgi:hypothetical protein
MSILLTGKIGKDHQEFIRFDSFALICQRGCEHKARGCWLNFIPITESGQSDRRLSGSIISAYARI